MDPICLEEIGEPFETEQLQVGIQTRGKEGNADASSRLPLKDSVNHTPKPADYVFVMNHMESTPVTPDYIREWTSRDPVLSQVREFVLKGWPSQGSPDIAPYWKRRDELSVHDGCIMWGARVIIPPQGRNRLTEELHDTHPVHIPEFVE